MDLATFTDVPQSSEMMGWDLELFAGVLRMVTLSQLGGHCGAWSCGAGASAALSCFPGNFGLFTQRGEGEANGWWLVAFLKAYSSL